MRLRSIIPAFPGPWANRFADLPLLKTVAQLPADDGDLSELEDLADRVMTIASQVFTHLSGPPPWNSPIIADLLRLQGITKWPVGMGEVVWPEYPSFQQLWEQA